MTNPEKWRNRAKSALRGYFRRRSFPRLTLSLLLAITGGFGFLVSDGMLRLGVEHMWVRYPIAVLASYAFLLGLIRVWVEVEKARFEPEEHLLKDVADDDEDRDRLHLRSVQERSWLDYLDVPVNVFDFDEGCLPVILILAVVAVVALLVTTVAAAPALLAEVFLDVFIISALYRRLRVAQKEHWLGTALRKTWSTAFITAILLSISGFVLELMAPGARSIGKAIEQILSD
ncbi:MAG TPA: hypothetical protein VG095_10090 [Chthoniobacterales bacterium]|nr:hypothetical protein [Chthoniobacterales bacterium]